MKKLPLFLSLFVIILLSSCKSGNDRGQLVGVNANKKFFPEKPFGMVLIPGGAFTMGKGDEDVAGAFSAPARTVTVRPFYMDDTEITNSEYREFVFRVRDSILRTKLAILAEEASIGGGSPIEQSKGDMSGISKYKFKEQDSAGNAYYKYMMDNYGSLGDINSPTEGRYLNWDVELIWNPNEFPDEYYAEAMDSMYMPIDEAEREG